MFKLKKDFQNQIRWTLQDAGNYKVILRSSEGYLLKDSAKHSISVSKSCLQPHNFRKGTASNNQFYFVQIANNGEEIGISEFYHNSTDRDNGINSVIRNAPTAPVVDETSNATTY